MTPVSVHFQHEMSLFNSLFFLDSPNGKCEIRSSSGSVQVVSGMRVLLVGVGGAGCRLVDSIIGHDKKSRSPRCTDGVAVDRDADSLNALENLPLEQRIYYQPLDPGHNGGCLPNDLVVTRLQVLNPGDIDAFFICAGIGGELAAGIPALVQQMKKTMIEPVYGLFVLPCTREGDQVCAKAADTLDSLLPVMNGTILYDDELFYDRYQEEGVTLSSGGDTGGRIPLLKAPPSGPEIAYGYRAINTMIAKQVTLLLRAGEAGEHPGTEVGEVALDAGEIMNTMNGMGCIALGYAREPVPVVHPDLIRRLRPVTHSLQDSHLKAQRLVEIARKAVSDGLSIACDLSGAEKALLLIAGPPPELSMRGYMTIRHWIDRTIRGQEVRSGDYPVSGTGFIAVIILLAGLENIQKVEQLRGIRDRFRAGAPGPSA
jgi:cell division GTPase FtsZ